MSELIIKRKKEFTFGMTKTNIYLDNKKIGDLKNGEFKKWKIENGKHTLYAKSGLTLKSQEITFNAKDNDTIALEIESFKNGFIKSFLQIKKLEPDNL